MKNLKYLIYREGDYYVSQCLTDIPHPYFEILAFYNKLILNNFFVLSYFYANP